MLSLIYLVISIVAGYYTSEWYSQNYGALHVHARLWNIIIFVVTMVVTNNILKALL